MMTRFDAQEWAEEYKRRSLSWLRSARLSLRVGNIGNARYAYRRAISNWRNMRRELNAIKEGEN